MTMTANVQLRLGSRDGLDECRAPAVLPMLAGIADACGWSMRDENIDSSWYRSPRRLRSTIIVLKCPVLFLALARVRRTEDPDRSIFARNGNRLPLVLQVDQVFDRPYEFTALLNIFWYDRPAFFVPQGIVGIQ